MYLYIITITILLAEDVIRRVTQGGAEEEGGLNSIKHV